MNTTVNTTVTDQPFMLNDTIKYRKCSNVFPKAAKYYKDLNDIPEELAMIAVCGVMSIATISIYVFELLSKHFRYLDPGKRLKTLILLGLYPMTSFMSLFALLVPRSTFLVDLIASFYLSLCIYVFMSILVQYYGGTNNMLSYFKDTKLSIQTPPCCCCCCCLPLIHLSRRNMYIIRVLISQVAVLQPILLFIKAVVWSDDNIGFAQGGSASPFMVVNVVSGISTLLAVYGLMINVRASQEILKKHKIKAKFSIIQLVLLFTNLQSAIFSIFSRFNLPPCYKRSGSKVRGSVYHHMIVIGEMLLLAILARMVYRKSESRDLTMLQEKTSEQCAYTSIDHEVTLPSTETRADLIDNMQTDDMAIPVKETDLV